MDKIKSSKFLISVIIYGFGIYIYIGLFMGFKVFIQGW